MAWPTKTDFVDGDVLSASQMNNIGTNLNLFNPTSATNGQVWLANGSGSGSYSTLTTGGYTSIASGTFTSGNTTLTLSSISGSYKHLYLSVYNLTFTASSPIIYVRLNNNSSGSYYSQFRYGSTTTPAVTSDATNLLNEWRIANGIASGNVLGFQLWIPNYTQTTDPTIRGNWNYFSNNNDGIVGAGRLNLLAGAAVNRIDVVASTSTFAGGSYILYGVN